MPELSADLYEWESKAFARKRKPASMSIEVEGDAVVIAGPASVIKKAVDLGFLHYVEFDGLIRAAFDDPIPNRARQMVNGLLEKMRSKRK